jgi:hypothetical protein
MALCAGGNTPNITAFHFRGSVVLVSGQCGVPPCPAITKLSRGVRCVCSVRPLRPPASLLHNAALPSVAASRCAKAPLGAGHRLRALRVKATGVLQSGLRWRRSHSRRRFPVAGAPYTPPSARPCGCACTVALVRRCALCCRLVACGQSCGVCPRPPVGLAAARLGFALNCPSAPRGGSLSQRNTGLSGANAQPFQTMPKGCYTVQSHVPAATWWLHEAQSKRPCYLSNRKVFNIYMGWLMGLEPTTTGITILTL